MSIQHAPPKYPTNDVQAVQRGGFVRIETTVVAAYQHVVAGLPYQVFDAEQPVLRESIYLTVPYSGFARIYGDCRVFCDFFLHAVAGQGAAEDVVRIDAFAFERGFAER